MFELPEFITLARQINETVTGKVVRKGSLGNTPHKFVWYNLTPAEFEARTRGKRVGKAGARGKWLLVPMEPDHVLVFGECGGRVLYHPAGSKEPLKYHLRLSFEDGSSFTATTQMWGAMELHAKGAEHNRKYIKDMRTTPVDPGFTYEYFSSLVDAVAGEGKRSVKGLLTQEQLIPGLGNAIAQDILFKARLHPRHPADALDEALRRALYDAIMKTVREVVAKGGRSDEHDLHGRPGGYERIMDSEAAGHPCPECGDTIVKIQYLGGACYLCPSCQK
jgi:formamidopyrimidine-DNA glycosylase